MKVMILDDDPLILSLLGHIFHHRGYEVVTYSNPKACPAYLAETCRYLIEQTCPRVIISDYDMPFVNGLEFFEALRKKGCRCAHMVMVSGSNPPPDVLNRVAELGIKFFAKPFHRNQIIDWLDQVEASQPAGKAAQPSSNGVNTALAPSDDGATVVAGLT
jgi:CheY-like chemotaxis protein